MRVADPSHAHKELCPKEKRKEVTGERGCSESVRIRFFVSFLVAWLLELRRAFYSQSTIANLFVGFGKRSLAPARAL